MAKQADDEASKPWMIRDVPEHIRRKVKTFAAQNNMTVGHALAHLVTVALEAEAHGGDEDKPMLHVVLNTDADVERITSLMQEYLDRKAAEEGGADEDEPD